MANGRETIPDSVLPFTPAGFGLLDTASDLAQQIPGTHWQMGLTYEPICADATATYAQCFALTPGSPATELDEPEAPADKAATFETLIKGATPFTVYAEHDCSSPTEWARAVARTKEALTRTEAYVVESVFWTGQAGGATDVVWPHLAVDATFDEEGSGSGGATLQEAATEIASGTPLGIVDALGELEGAIASCYKGGVPTLHVPRKLIPRMAAWNLISVRNGRIFTTLGSKVAAGAGYPGTGPDGTEAAGVEWIYATGEVFYRRGEVFSPNAIESFDRANNTVKAIAERTYVIGWDCCVIAIPVSIEEGGES